MNTQSCIALCMQQVLTQIGAHHVPQLEVYNKIDQLDAMSADAQQIDTQGTLRVWMSCHQQQGKPALLQALQQQLKSHLTQTQLSVPTSEGRLRAQLHACGAVVSEQYHDDVAQGAWQLEISVLTRELDSLTEGRWRQFEVG